MLYLIGGCPMLGKTTTARELSFQHHIPCFGTDDFCCIVGKVSDEFTLFRSMPYYDYFTRMPIGRILDDAKEYQKRIERLLVPFMEEKAAEGNILMEGFCIFPHMIPQLREKTKALFFVGTDRLIEQQYRALGNFGAKSADKAIFDRNYLHRLKWYNSTIRKEAVQLSMSYIELDSFELDICHQTAELLGL